MAKFDNGALTKFIVAGAVGVSGFYLYRRLTRRGNSVPGPSFRIHKVFSLNPFDLPHPFEASLPPNPLGKYGPIFGVWLGLERVIIINDVDIALEMLVKKGSEFASRPAPLSATITTEGGQDIALNNYTPTMKIHRKIAFQALRDYLSGNHLEVAIYDSFDKMAVDLDKVAISGETMGDMRRYLEFVLYNSLTKTCLNHEFENCTDKDFLKIVEDFTVVNEIFFNGIFEDVFPYFSSIWKSENLKKLEKGVKSIFDYFKSVTQEHEQTLNENCPKDILDHLLIAQKELLKQGQSEEVMTATNIRQILIDLYTAGTDTTIHTLYWCIFFMAYYPDVQEKIFKEVEEVYGLHEHPTLDQRSKLVYTDAALHEAMRRGTIATFNLPHAAASDSTLADYDIPKDSTVLVNMYAVHHDEKYWPEPFSFRPERFIEEGLNGPKLASKQKAFMPFSAGPRACLGQAVAKADSFLLLILLVQRYKFEWLAEQPRPAEHQMYKPYSRIGAPVDFELIITKRI